MPSRIRFLIALLHAVVVTDVVTAQTQASIYINAGGPEYVDTNGNTWMADTYYNTGKTYSVSSSISNTSDEALYQDERWDPALQPDLLYDIPIENGDYGVVLHFAEVYLSAAGERVFTVTAEGQVVIQSLDIFERVGANTALKIQVPVTVSDGSLSIGFQKGIQSPKVNAIEVHSVRSQSSSPSAAPSEEVEGTAAPTFSRVVSMFPSLQPSNAPSQVPSQAPSYPNSYLRSSLPTVTASDSPSLLPSSETSPDTPAFESIYINAGGSSDYTDIEGRVWSKDMYFSGGKTFTARGATISGTDDDVLFLSERYSLGGVLIYDIPISSVGDYDVTLLFAENYVTNAGLRVFSISIEGIMIDSDFDIYDISGGFNTAFNMTERVSVLDGSLSITFTPGIVQNPKISAIMVEAVSSPPVSSGTSNAPSMMPSESLYPSMRPSSEASDMGATSGVVVDATNSTDASDSTTIALSISTTSAVEYTTAETATPTADETSPTSTVVGTTTSGIEATTTTAENTESTTDITDTTSISAAQPKFELRINCAGPEYVDINNNVWLADAYFNTGNSYSVSKAILNTQDDALYQKERWCPPSGGNLTYTIPNIPNGDYEVTLHWAEVYAMSVEQRVFDVAVQGEVAIENLDIFASAGKDTALSLSTAATVVNEEISISFLRKVENPKINAIELRLLPSEFLGTVPLELGTTTSTDASDSTIVALTTTPEPATPTADETSPTSTVVGTTTSGIEATAIALTTTAEPATPTADETSPASTVVGTTTSGIEATTTTAEDTESTTDIIDTTSISAAQPEFELRINCAGPEYVDINNNVWLADAYFNTGNSYSVSKAILNTQDDALYQKERWCPPSGGNLTYTIPNIPNGDYEVTLHWAEVYAMSVEQRVFDVAVQGEVAIENLDIFASAGKDTALSLSTAATVVNEEISISFLRKVENPKINAIELRLLPSEFLGTVPLELGTTTSTDASDSTTVALTTTPEPTTATADETSPTSTVVGTTTSGIEATATTAEDTESTIALTTTAEPATPTADETSPASTVVGTTTSGIEATTTTAENTESTTDIIDTTSISAAQPEFELRINCAGPEYVDINNNVWLADAYFNTGNSYSVSKAILNTQDDALYQKERWCPPSGGNLTYTIPNIPNGDYEVTLHWAEVYATSVEQRVFDVAVQGEVAIENLDIFASAGKDTALSLSTVTTVADEVLSISFLRKVENPKINAIEIRSITPTVSTSTGAPGSMTTFELDTSTLSADSTSTTTTGAQYAMTTFAMDAMTTEEVVASTTEATETTILEVPVPSSAPVTFEPIYINTGSDTPILDPNTGITWEADNFFNTGKTSTTKEATQEISNTNFDELYRTERWDEYSYPNLQYDIPLDDGRFRVVLHFAEIWKGTQSANYRVFNVYIEDVLEIENLDIYDRVGKYAAFSEEFILDISDGDLSIMLEHVIENPKISGIEIHSVGVVKPHYAHAVPGGPYVGTDINDSGNATIAVNGFFSHTHAPGATLVSWIWMVDDVVVATGEQAEISFDVGDHILVLEVEDSVGDVSADFTTVSVRPYGYPYIESLTPAAGEMIGGDKVTIYGSGFNISASETFVTFGEEILSGPSEITIVDDNTIEVLANPQRSWGKVEVTVTTPLDISNEVIFEYLPKIPLTFKTGNIATGLYGPTVSAIGNDGNLYVGTQGGELMKYILDDNHNVVGEGPIVANVTLSETYLSRTILGITFDPMDTSPFPAVYISHSTLYHGELPTSFNGVISRVTGENLDTIEHVISGLPISDHDHGVNGMTFDDNGNLYIQVGGNTNAGVPGALSTSQTQEEDLFSAATLIARNVTSPTFDGHLTYNTNGDQTGGWDVEVFASGQRNPYDIVYHSNGKMYGTDNGPNYKFGKISVGCGDGEEYEGDDPFEPDKLNLLEEGHYYGHPNRKRGETDSRQCEWRSAFQKSANYTMPIKKLYSSSNGICEFESNHFGGALRGDLIIGRYKGALYHVKLTNEGQKAAGALQEQPPVLVKQGGLSVSQGPDGTLFAVSNFVGNVFYHAPDEEEAEIMTVKSIFPRRGPEAGNTTLKIFGQKMFNATADPLVTVGGLDCPVVDRMIYTDVASREMQWVKCTLPAGVGKSDVVVSFGEEVSTFSSYRYIPGQ